MKLPIYQVDAFTGTLFHGNPAAVVILDAWLPDHLLCAIAAENNLAETAFVMRSAQAWSLRWFTPTVEVDLCGHATLATAHVLFSRGMCTTPAVAFDTKSGRLSVDRRDDHYVLDFPARPGKPVPVTDDIIAALRATPKQLLRARDLMAVFGSEAEVVALAPDMARLAALDAYAVIVTAPGDHVDFVSRFFAPAAGIPEDPVTGSAHCTLTPYWAGQLGRNEMHARQVSARGGELYCRLDGDRVHIAGRAVDYLEGHIQVDIS